MDDKEKIIRSLETVRKNVEVVISSLKELDGDTKTNRLATNRITFTIFDVVDELTSTEIKIYNYMRRRQHGLHTKKGSKEGAR